MERFGLLLILAVASPIRAQSEGSDRTTTIVAQAVSRHRADRPRDAARTIQAAVDRGEPLARAILDVGPDVLRAWRDLYEAEARNHFRRALSARDDEAMAEVHRRFFPSSVGDDAAYWLARVRMDRGEYAAALGLLAGVDPAGGDAPVRHPDPDVPAGPVRARIVVCHLVLGDAATARLVAAALPEADRRRIDRLLEGSSGP